MKDAVYPIRPVKFSTFHLIVLFHILLTLYLTFFEKPLPIFIGLLTILGAILAVRFYRKNRTAVHRHPIMTAYALLLVVISITGLVYSLKNFQWEGFGLTSTVYNSHNDAAPVYRYKIRPNAEREYPQFPRLPRSNRFANLPEQVPFYVVNEGFLRVDEEGIYMFRVDRVRDSQVFLDGNRISNDQGVYLSPTLHTIRIQYWKDTRTTNFLPKWYRVGSHTDVPAAFSNIPLTHLFPSEEAFMMKNWLYVKYYTPYMLLVLWLPIAVGIGIKFITNRMFRKQYLHYALLAIILLCGVWLRWFLLTTTFQFPDADEASIGTMGIKMLKGDSFLMYYGAPYNGSFDSLLASFWFVLLGVNNLALKCHPFLVSLILIALIYRVGHEIYTAQTGLLAALFASIGTPFMTEWGLKVRGGHLAALLVGTLLLLLVYRTVFKQQTISQAYPMMGFLAGVSCWMYTGSIVYIATAILFLVLHDKKFLVKRQFLWFSVYFVLGALPLLIWNMQNGFETIHFLSTRSLPFMHNLLRSDRNLQNMIENLLTVIGLSSSIGLVQIAALKYTTLAIYACLVLHLVITRDKGIYSLCKLSVKKSNGTDMLIVLAVLTIFLYFYSQFGYYEDTARYFLPFITILPLLLARFVFWVTDRNFTAAIFIVLFLLYINLLGNFRVAHSQLNPLQKDLTHVVHFLEDKEITYLVGPYWLVGRIVFESEEQILALPFSYASVPHLPYQDVFKRLDSKEIAYIAETGDVLNIPNIDQYTRMGVGDFTVYVHQQR